MTADRQLSVKEMKMIMMFVKQHNVYFQKELRGSVCKDGVTTGKCASLCYWAFLSGLLSLSSNDKMR